MRGWRDPDGQALAASLAPLTGVGHNGGGGPPADRSRRATERRRRMDLRCAWLVQRVRALTPASAQVKASCWVNWRDARGPVAAQILTHHPGTARQWRRVHVVEASGGTWLVTAGGSSGLTRLPSRVIRGEWVLVADTLEGAVELAKAVTR